MNTLKETVQASLKKRRKEGSPKLHPHKKKKKKIFEVSIAFNVTKRHKIIEIVPASNEKDAKIIAKKLFNDIEKHHLAFNSERVNSTPLHITDEGILDVNTLSGLSLSYKQREVLKLMHFKKLKLYPLKYFNHLGGKVLKKYESEHTLNQNRYISRSTVKALYRKGLIIAADKLIKDQEYTIQKTLGTLPPNNVLVINPAMLKMYNIKLKESG